MTACGRFQDSMVEGLYGELREERLREFNEHLSACASCAALYGDLSATVATMHERRRPDPGAAFWDGYWQRLEERVALGETVVGAPRFERRWPLGSWGYRVAAAVIILAAGIWIGRTVLEPAPRSADRSPETTAVPPGNDAERPVPAESAAEPDAAPLGRDDETATVAARGHAIDAPASEKDTKAPGPLDDAAPAGVITAASAGDDALRYIGRSQVVLLALLNAENGDTGETSYTSESAQARVLVAEAQRLQDGLTRPQDRRLRELVGQLEMILREIANLEADNDLDAVQMIRNRVGREGVLLQIDLRQMREASASSGRAKSDANPIH